METDSGVPDLLSVCDSFVASLGGPEKRASKSK